MNQNQNEVTNTTQHFFKKAKKMPWVIDIYIAIQAAMALNAKHVLDFNDLADDIMPRADRFPRAGLSLGQEGLTVLGILFDFECIEAGPTNYHEYRFTRKTDGKTVIGTVKI